MTTEYKLYDCGICECCHPWDWYGDCRDDKTRTFPDEYAKQHGIDVFDIEIFTWEERLQADKRR